ncbi:MAG: hypothetical protein KatS3mg076_2730 [Candidatus Binatia bacterium]|nr:MAG: hypothetical protein KatS3mg076_2730 [Candidatus Binatia bacterium]
MRASPGRVSLLLGFAFASFFAAGCALLAAGAVAGGAAGTAASVSESREEKHAPVTYVGTVLVNVPYVPAKAVFAAGGALLSGLAYVASFGDRALADRIWTRAVGGSYVVTPRMLEGREPVRFLGGEVSSGGSRGRVREARAAAET